MFVFVAGLWAMFLPPSVFSISQEAIDLILLVIIWSGISGTLLALLEDSAITLSEVYHSDRSAQGIRTRIRFGAIFAILPTFAVVTCMVIFSVKPPFTAAGWLFLTCYIVVMTPSYFSLGWKIGGKLTRVFLRLKGN